MQSGCVSLAPQTTFKREKLRGANDFILIICMLNCRAYLHPCGVTGVACTNRRRRAQKKIQEDTYIISIQI